MLTHCLHPFLFRFLPDVSDLYFLYISLPSMTGHLSCILVPFYREMMTEITHGLSVRPCLLSMALAISVYAVFIAVTIESIQ